MVKTGLDLFEKRWPRALRGARAGLLVHPASVDRGLRHAVDLFMKSRKVELRALFGPQHGIHGQTQDNMVEWSGFRDPRTGLPVYSLYGMRRKPSPRMLSDIDALIIDLQDIGSRYYTFIWTMALCIEACRDSGKAVIVLDRPNPIDGQTMEGTVQEEGFLSFVGLNPIPVRHAMTAGEIAGYLAGEFYPEAELHIITMAGWTRRMRFDRTGLPWIMPSPNMPTPDTALVYPGMCLLEGTNISEGRGTTRPFEIFGAPFIEPDKIVSRLNKFRLRGVRFRPLHFEPVFQKHAGKICGGAQIHITDSDAFRPFKTGVAALKSIHDLYPEEIRWNPPPYEYEYEKMPIDVLAGTDRLRLEIQRGCALKDMEKWWTPQCHAFRRNKRAGYLLYD